MRSTETTPKWDNKEMPKGVGRKAFVLPGAFFGSCATLMAEAGYSRANTVEEADVVVFIGGEDVNPALYGHDAHPSTYFTEDRDIVEETYYHKCIDLKKPMFGICRGAQFLHAMNGGKLWQNVNNHAGSDHTIIDVEDNVTLTVTSLHHQMLQNNDKIEVIAVCANQVATSFEEGSMKMTLSSKSQEIEIEAGCYTDTRCFFVQGHPEIGSAEYRSWTMSKLDQFLYDWESVAGSPEPLELEVLQQIG